MATTLNLTVRDDRTLRVLAEWPDEPGPFAAVVLAPGQRYPLDKPLIASCAQALLSRGLAVYRFDWAMPHAGATLAAANDLAQRVEDMQAVVRAARGHAQVDPARVFVGGKSLGSVVAWALMRRDPVVRGALLLTPLCAAPTDASVGQPARHPAHHYPDMAREGRPVLFLAGDADPLCDVATLHRLAAQACGPCQVHVLGGNHALADASDGDPDAEQRRAADAGRLVAEFVAKHVAG